VIATPPETVPGIVADFGKHGSRAAVVITAGFGSGPDSLRQKLLDAARPNTLRVFGPNCLGLLVPGIGLDASFSHAAPEAGDLALLSQSGAVLTTVIDWAKARNIGFSAMVSLGDMADVDFGDLLDWFAADIHTRAILLYVEAITHPKKFMSAARGGRSDEAGHRHQGRTARRSRQGGRLPYRGTGRSRRGLRRRLPSGRAAARP
jgi:acetyltransferase